MSASDAETREAPDYPLTRLAFRVWRLHRPTRILLSLNAPQAKTPWIAAALAAPAGGWPQDGGRDGHPRPLVATCDKAHDGDHNHDDGDGDDGDGDDGDGDDGTTMRRPDPVPGENCSCGIYATTDLDVIDGYLSAAAPVLGIVELGGRVVRATQGYRAAYARIAAILLIDQHLTLPHAVLEEIASAYQIPALVPHSADPEHYRGRLREGRSVGEEAEDWLRGLGGAA